MKVKRNELCPCGSGKKFKKCCGGFAQSEINIKSHVEKVSSSPRACGECTACCEGWLTTHALGYDIYLDHPCPHCDGQGCSIHAKRPENPCRLFFCGWAQAGSELPQWMHPKECGVIILTDRMHWEKMPVDILVSAENDPDGKLIQWFQNRCWQQGRGFIYQKNNQWFGYGPQQFQLDLSEKINRGEALWDGALLPE